MSSISKYKIFQKNCYGESAIFDCNLSLYSDYGTDTHWDNSRLTTCCQTGMFINGDRYSTQHNSVHFDAFIILGNKRTRILELNTAINVDYRSHCI